MCSTKLRKQKNSTPKQKEAVLEVDKEWKFFAETLKTAYDRERAAYVEQRASAMEELSTRKEKLKELQDAMRQSAMAQSLMEGEDVPQEGIMEDGYTIPPDPVEPISGRGTTRRFHGEGPIAKSKALFTRSFGVSWQKERRASRELVKEAKIRSLWARWRGQVGGFWW